MIETNSGVVNIPSFGVCNVVWKWDLNGGDHGSIFRVDGGFHFFEIIEGTSGHQSVKIRTSERIRVRGSNLNGHRVSSAILGDTGRILLETERRPSNWIGEWFSHREILRQDIPVSSRENKRN
jgi:hypothetical protein